MKNFIPLSKQNSLHHNSKYYGGRDITGRLLPVDTAIGLLKPESIVLIDDIEGEYNTLIEALDGKVVKP